MPPIDPMMKAEWISTWPEAPAIDEIPAIMLDEIVSTLQTQLVCCCVRQQPQIAGLNKSTVIIQPAIEASLSIMLSNPIVKICFSQYKKFSELEFSALSCFLQKTRAIIIESERVPKKMNKTPPITRVVELGWRKFWLYLTSSSLQPVISSLLMCLKSGFFVLKTLT